jgi:hypothetical protein
VDSETKFEPTTLSVNPAPPWSLLLGEIAVIVGAGFACWGGGTTGPAAAGTERDDAGNKSD